MNKDKNELCHFLSQQDFSFAEIIIIHHYQILPN